MISFKDNIIVDNSHNAKSLRISTSPPIDLSINALSVRLLRLDSPDKLQLVGECTSTNIIEQSEQLNNFSFEIPITQGKFSIDVKFLSDKELVDDFIVKPI